MKKHFVFVISGFVLCAGLLAEEGVITVNSPNQKIAANQHGQTASIPPIAKPQTQGRTTTASPDPGIVSSYSAKLKDSGVIVQVKCRSIHNRIWTME